VHVLLAMDISAAFDAVNHLILCKHIESDFGVTGTALSWLRSFASDRSQYVAVGTWLNEVRDVCFIVRRPTGKCVGALLFAVYVSEIDDVIQSHSVQYHQYADNLMIYLSLVPKAFDDLSSLIGCSDAVSTWFLQNALLLKPAKTEAIIFGTRQRLAGIQTSAGVSVAGTVVHFAEAVKLLGVTLDSALTFSQHVTNVVRACTYHTRSIRHIRPLLTVDTAKSIATSIVGARLDYCNSLLYDTSEGNLEGRLQRVQSQLARVVLQAPWTASATDMRRQLHWLPGRQRIVFKRAADVKSTLSGLLSYLQYKIHDYHPYRTLRSTSALLLQQYHHHHTFIDDGTAARAFCAVASTVWNSLGVNTRSADTFLTFKNRQNGIV